MIEVKGLYHSYSEKENAVEDLNFNIQKGEIFGFLGPSGAGKSTTQNILTGLLPLQKGNVTIAGIDMKKPTRDLFNKIGVSFEHANAYGRLTGLENLEFHRKLYDVPTLNSLELLKMVGLEDSAKKKASAYSKGMKHRLIFVRSMLNNPEIWFLDEPTSGLDPSTASVIKEIIRKKNEEGTTIFLTTHNMYVAEELCDRVAFINNGKIVLIDSPRNLKLQYGEKVVEVDHIEEDELKNQKFSLSSERDVDRLNKIIKAGNIEMMHTKEATLEDVFIKVTGRRLQ